MSERETRTLSRACEVVQIPSGDRMSLPAGTDVVIMQSLGGAYTVYADNGSLYRLNGADADAIGMPVTVSPAHAAGENLTLEEKVWEELKTCYDPEIPVNIVDLGLIYLCEVTPLAPNENRVDVEMTLTAPGCGMGQVLKDDVEKKVKALPGVKDVHVELVFEPAWDRSMMSEAARLQLGFF